MNRYPIAPLMKAAGIDTMKELRSRFPMNGQAYRTVLDDGLTQQQADRWAVRLGLLPVEVWENWPTPTFDVCASYGCGEWFEVPAGRGGHQVYCSPRCKNREKKRRYRNTPHGAETNRRHRNRYYDERERRAA